MKGIDIVYTLTVKGRGFKGYYLNLRCSINKEVIKEIYVKNKIYRKDKIKYYRKYSPKF